MTYSSDDSSEKVARESLFWALFLTGTKLFAGLSVNSIGILSEAMHSGIDLVSAGITWGAVRMARRPADRTHPYGYGKIENLSALGEALLLLLTCGWIIHEAVDRLMGGTPASAFSWLGIVVMLISLAVDTRRAYVLHKAAQKYRSQALKADALHFATDISSTCVVLFGLVLLQTTRFLQEGTLLHSVLLRSDAIAALLVSIMVAVSGIRLSKRAVAILMDSGQADVSDKFEKMLQKAFPNHKFRCLRLRESGANTFADMTVEVPAELSLEEAHDIANRIEKFSLERMEFTDVTVHVEPARSSEPTLDNTLRIARGMARDQGFSIHHLVLARQNDGLVILVHAEINPDMPLLEAHKRVSKFENRLRQALGAVRIETHIEPEEFVDGTQTPAPAKNERELQNIVNAVLSDFPTVQKVHRIRLNKIGNKEELSLHCLIDGTLSVAEAHETVSRLERALLHKMQDMGRILVHMEPCSKDQLQHIGNNT